MFSMDDIGNYRCCSSSELKVDDKSTTYVILTKQIYENPIECPKFEVASGLGPKHAWDTSKVTDMSNLFENKILATI